MQLFKLTEGSVKLFLKTTIKPELLFNSMSYRCHADLKLMTRILNVDLLHAFQDARVSNAFAAAAFRIGHTFIPSIFRYFFTC
jgi:hypothetical protein